MSFQEAPAAAAPKSNQDFVHLDPLPEDGQQILTIVATNYIKEHTQFNKEKQIEETFPAIEFYLGGMFGGKPGFVKTWPVKYSIHEKATYSKYYRAALGKEPNAGSKPSDLIGAGLTVTVKNEDKVSKKGTPYKRSRVGEVASVHPKLKGEIVAVATLKPALEAALAAGKNKGQDNAKDEAPS